jgi:DNA polymerase-3 subunit beta
LDIQLDTKVAAKVETEGKITVPAKLLTEIVRKVPDEAGVTLETKANDKDVPVLQVRSGRSRFTLQTLPADDFPTFGEKDTNHSFALTGEDVTELFGRTQFAISTEETRYYLNGVYLHTHVDSNGNNGELRGCTTDGHRLARTSRPLPEGAHGFTSGSNPSGVIVPSQTVEEIIRLSGDTEKIGVKISPTTITVKADDTVLASKLIDGTFPDYARVVPTGNDKVLRADREELFNAIDRLAIVSTERGRGIKLSLTRGKLELSINSPDVGSASEELDVDYEGDPLDVGFNSRYLMDILDEIKSDRAEFKLADAGSPALIQGDTDAKALFVLMPMRVT